MAGMTHGPLQDFEKIWLTWIFALFKLLEHDDSTKKPSDKKTIPVPGPGGPKDRTPHPRPALLLEELTTSLPGPVKPKPL